MAACSSGSKRSDSELIELATSAIESETGAIGVTITDSFFGMNKGGLTALCGTATNTLGASAKFVVMFANGGEVADVSEEMQPASWPVFCSDAAKLRYVESQ